MINDDQFKTVALIRLHHKPTFSQPNSNITVTTSLESRPDETGLETSDDAEYLVLQLLNSRIINTLGLKCCLSSNEDLMRRSVTEILQQLLCLDGKCKKLPGCSRVIVFLLLRSGLNVCETAGTLTGCSFVESSFGSAAGVRLMNAKMK